MQVSEEIMRFMEREDQRRTAPRNGEKRRANERAKKEPVKTGIIGAGFSGMIAAIQIKRTLPENEVTLYESKSVPGKKILVTGNGRCNLTNEKVDFSFYKGDKDLFESVCKENANREMLSFFSSLGVVCRTDFAGRYYPVSNQASSVLSALKMELNRLGVKTVTDCKITQIQKKNRYVLNGVYECDYLVFACGGCAASVHGSDGSGFELLKAAGVEITPLYPSLCALYIDNFTKALKGVRAQGRITLRAGSEIIASDAGEIQYTDYGLSGIPAFQVSASAVRAFAAGQTVTAAVDAATGFTKDELTEYIVATAKKYPNEAACKILSGIMPEKLGAYYLTLASVNPEKKASCVSPGAAVKVASLIKSKKYEISTTGSFKDAQVTSGGIAAAELYPGTLELNKLRRAYACGEIIDVDGLCGGYNLQWAFSSATAVAASIVSEALNAQN